MYSRYKSFNKCIIKFFSSYFYRLSSLSWCHPWKDKSFEFWCSVISFFSSLLVLLLSYLRNHCLIQEPRGFTLVFSPEGFIGLVLTYESFIHFELFFMQCDVRITLHFAHVVQVSRPHFLRWLTFGFASTYWRQTLSFVPRVF